jgi:hypothetical protein
MFVILTRARPEPTKDPEMRFLTRHPRLIAVAAIFPLALVLSCAHFKQSDAGQSAPIAQTIDAETQVRDAFAHDESPPLASMAAAQNTKVMPPFDDDDDADGQFQDHSPALAPKFAAAGIGVKAESNAAGAGTNAVARFTIPRAAIAIEQTNHGTRPPPEMLASFDGLGESFTGPQGIAVLRNPSDNSLAVGPDHIVQIVNTRMAIFTKKGSKFDTTGKVLYGPVETRNVFKGFADAGEINNGDAVVRYDQLADRWLIVMPIFRRLPNRTNAPAPPKSGGPAQRSQAATNQPGDALTLFQPPAPVRTQGEDGTNGRGGGRGRRGQGGQGGQRRGPGSQVGAYAMCYAVSTGPDPLGSWYRYEFIRPLFPDYPRPAIWPDGYYVPSSTGDTVIQKQAFVADRAKMLKGEDATEQGLVIDGVNFLNNADVDGKQLPPPGAPNLMFAAGGSQLRKVLEDDGVYVWKYHVDWEDPSKTKAEGPVKIRVAPYHYLGGGQLTAAVPQPGTTRRLDAQGDKLMARLVYRRIGNQESIVAVHSISTSAGGGGVRWYEFRLDSKRNPVLYQQGTYCPGGDYRWLASPAMDALGNIGIGYSFGGTNDFAGQRFAARLPDDPLGKLTLHEAVLVEGEASQRELRWEDYAQTAMDPNDDRAIWYVGDYIKKGGTNYSSRIGAFRLPGGN